MLQILQQVFMLLPEEQLELFHGLETSLQVRIEDVTPVRVNTTILQARGVLLP